MSVYKYISKDMLPSIDVDMNSYKFYGDIVKFFKFFGFAIDISVGMSVVSGTDDAIQTKKFSNLLGVSNEAFYKPGTIFKIEGIDTVFRSYPKGVSGGEYLNILTYLKDNYLFMLYNLAMSMSAVPASVTDLRSASLDIVLNGKSLSYPFKIAVTTSGTQGLRGVSDESLEELFDEIVALSPLNGTTHVDGVITVVCVNVNTETTQNILLYCSYDVTSEESKADVYVSDDVAGTPLPVSFIVEPTSTSPVNMIFPFDMVIRDVIAPPHLVSGKIQLWQNGIQTGHFFDLGASGQENSGRTVYDVPLVSGTQLQFVVSKDLIFG